MRPSRLLHVLATLALAAACNSSGPTAVSYETGAHGFPSSYVSVSAQSEGLRVANQTDLPVFYFAVERSAIPYTDWVPCGGNSLALCVGISPGAIVTIPWSNVVGFRPDAVEYQFYWYHLINVNGTSTVAGLQSVTVKR
jgi:hypothetical protein